MMFQNWRKDISRVGVKPVNDIDVERIVKELRKMRFTVIFTMDNSLSFGNFAREVEERMNNDKELTKRTKKDSGFFCRKSRWYLE